MQKQIIDAAVENELYIFVGAGFSVPLGFPSWRKLAENAIDEFALDNPEVLVFKQALTTKVMTEILVFDALYDINETKIRNIIFRESNINFTPNMLVNHKLLWNISQKIII